MARPLRRGLDYFPLEVSIDEDDKFFDLFDEVGTDRGLGIAVMLLCQIYKTEGYYFEWNSAASKKFCRNKRLDKQTVDTALSILTGINKSPEQLKEDPSFFDNKAYLDYGILTSRSLQRRFFLATDRRKSRVIKREYILLPFEFGEVQTGSKSENGKRTPIFENTNFVTIDKKKIPFDFEESSVNTVSVNNKNVSVNNNPFIEHNNSIDDSESTQRRGKERKGEEKKGKESINGDFSFPHTITQQIQESITHWNGFDNLPWCDYLPVNIPNLSAITEKFSVFGFEEIKNAITNFSKFHSKVDAKYRPNSFHAFVEKSLDNWLDRAKPWERYDVQPDGWSFEAELEKRRNAQ